MSCPQSLPLPAPDGWSAPALLYPGRGAQQPAAPDSRVSLLQPHSGASIRDLLSPFLGESLFLPFKSREAVI